MIKKYYIVLLLFHLKISLFWDSCEFLLNFLLKNNTLDVDFSECSVLFCILKYETKQDITIKKIQLSHFLIK